MKSMFFALCLLFSGWSQAALIQLHADRSHYNVGDNITVTMSITNFSETIAGFKVETLYPSSIIALLNWQFGSGLDDGVGSSQSAEHNNVAGVIGLLETADFFADEGILAAQQGSSFILATFNFVAEQVGEVLLSFNAGNTEVISYAGSFIETNTTDLNFTVSAAQVPAPATAILMLVGLGLLYRRRQAK